MRRAAITGTLLTSILVLGLMLVPIVGARDSEVPLLQTVTAAATTAATAATQPTTAPSAATPTVRPGALPSTGGDSGISLILLGGAALLIMGLGTFLLMERRNTRM
jgi:LPXTG-motif cell wall-anchored protein